MRRVFLIAILGAACSKSGGALKIKDVTGALSHADLKVDGFQPSDATRFSAQRCEEGTVEGLDVVVCEYGSDEAAGMGKRAAEEWVAQATTGVALTNARTLLAVADRARTDPNGKTIHRMTLAYRKLK